MIRRYFFLSPAVAIARGCSGSRGDASSGRLTLPRSKPSELIGPGLHSLGLARERDGLIYVPPSYDSGKRIPLVVYFHGAGGAAARAMQPMQPLADRHGFLVLAPDSRGRTWDVVNGALGPDVEFLNLALAWVCRHCAIDTRRLAASGFSDGASYALSLGLLNGSVFSHILAFSPGFVTARERSGHPLIFVSHGTRDQVLPIERCSRRIVPQLKEVGYSVNYVEFDGPHQTPADIRERAVKWFIG